jgi:ketosteroid isomerase-like protein
VNIDHYKYKGMIRKALLIPVFCMLAVIIAGNKSYAEHRSFKTSITFTADTLPPPQVLDVINAVINAVSNFKIDAVANLYTPNALIADDEPPYSWNGPTAGVQWVNAVEKICKDIHLTKFKGVIQNINVYQQSADNVYIVVPVNFSGIIKGQGKLTTRGAFTFVLRFTNDKWLIKSQVWMPEKGLKD